MKNPHHVLVNKNCPVQGLTRQELGPTNNPVRSDHIREGDAFLRGLSLVLYGV